MAARGATANCKAWSVCEAWVASSCSRGWSSSSAQSHRVIFQIVDAVSRRDGPADAISRGVGCALAEEICTESIGLFLCPRSAAQSQSAFDPRAQSQHSVEFGVLSRFLNVFLYNDIHVNATGGFPKRLLKRADGRARAVRARRGHRHKRAVSDSVRVHGCCPGAQEGEVRAGPMDICPV